MKQDWINNNQQGREIYEILDSNLPTVESGGAVTEEQIWNCVNLILEKIKPKFEHEFEKSN